MVEQFEERSVNYVRFQTHTDENVFQDFTTCEIDCRSRRWLGGPTSITFLHLLLGLHCIFLHGHLRRLRVDLVLLWDSPTDVG